MITYIARKEDYHIELDFVLKHYNDYLNPLLLGTELELLTTAMTSVNKPTLHDVLDYLKSVSEQTCHKCAFC